MGRKKPVTRDEEGAGGGGGGKSKKKNYMIDDDEYSVGTELSEEPVVQEERPVPGGGKKKGKKGKKAAFKDEDDDDDIVLKDVEDDDDEEPVVQFGGKKKSKGKKGGSKSGFSAFELLGEEEDNEEDDGEDDSVDKEDDDENIPAFVGKKKPFKSKKGGGKVSFSSSAFDAIEDEDGEESLIDDSVSGKHSDEEDDPVISFSGKKKSKLSKKGGNVFSASVLDGLDDQGDGKTDENEEAEEDVTSFTFTGKKKKSSKSSKKNSALSSDDVNEEGAPVPKTDNQVLTMANLSLGEEVGLGDEDAEITFSGKKKSSKKKSSSAFSALEAGLGDESVDSTQITSGKEVDDLNKNQSNVDAVGTSKNKKKKKKNSERTVQEEDELDKILAELGEGPSEPKAAPSNAPVPEEKLQTEPGPGEKEAEEDGPVESAAAKKKKKKKEKEKEKKVAAAAAVEEKQEQLKNESNKSKVADKKVPKHVREMQERLAKLKEAEEKKKREEEEKLRKEEEERLRQEELERLAEEKKRLKKEREKEKLLKKKQEGKLLTGKQKEEARRLEAMRKQILANAGGLPSALGDTGEMPVKKKPIYKTKKSKPQSQVNGAASAEPLETPESKGTPNDALSELDTKEIEEVEDEPEEVKPPVSDIKENGEEEEEEEDEDWDARSWDAPDLKLPGKSAFSDEEVDSEPEPVMKREVKSTQPNSREPSSLPPQSLNGQGNQHDSDTERTEKTKKKGQVKLSKKEKVDGSAGPTESNLRSPICCIMGHVDTGKTKLLDCIRGTNVQEGEAGGITQQIGATYFPAENIRERTKELKADAKLNVPGLLVIDTPGHESFTNLRSRGSGLCDIAILVVDIMHGLEPQTIESLNLLKMRNTEFVVALNKVDRLYGWKTCRNAPIVKAMKQQSKDVQNEFNQRLTHVITQFKEQGLNTELYYKNKEMGETFSIVPTSAISGEGIPDMLLLLVQWTQKTMTEKLTFSNEIECTVLEVKVVEGHGTTIDVVLVNGVLHEGDQIVVCGMQGPIATNIRALLTPHPMKELRVKGTYLHHKEIKAAQGIKITAQGLEHAIAGTSLHVVGPNDDLEDIMESAMEDMRSVMSRIDKSGEGVCVQASTLGSLEALLEFLKTPVVNIPVSGISIGPVHKKDVMKASVMLEKKKEYATILAFDVKVTQDARELADDLGVRIFCADIIYHLFDQFKAYIDNLKEERRRESAEEAVFPCVLKIVPGCIFNKKDPIVLGVDVVEGMAKIGTPLCVPQKEFIEIGRIASIENNHKTVDYAKKGQTVAIKIVGSNSEEQQKMYGRHFEVEDELVSRISRRSIDILKEHHRSDLNLEEWKLVMKLKTLFKIQ